MKNNEQIINNFLQKNKATDTVASFQKLINDHFDQLEVNTMSKEDRDILKRTFRRKASEMKVQIDMSQSAWSKMKGKEKEKEEVKAFPANSNSLQKKIVYFNDNNLTRQEMKWVVDGEDCSSVLSDYREAAIDAAREGKNLSDSHALMLNYIVKFDKKLSVLEKLNLKEKTNAVKQQLNASQGYESQASSTTALCYEIVQKFTVEDQDDAEAFLLEKMLEAKKEKDKKKSLCLDLMYAFIKKIDCMGVLTEQPYVDSTLLPFFEYVFDNIQNTEHLSAGGRLENDCSPTSLSASSSATAATATSSNKRPRSSASSTTWLSLQPDYLLKTISGSKKFDLFAVEVKKPKAKSSQLLSDEVKLGNILKLMLDRLVMNGVPSPVTCGFIDTGNMVKTFKMQITSKGKYEYVELACFRGIRCLDDLVLLPSVINHFMQLRALICQTQQSINDKMLGKSSPGFVVPRAWLRPSLEYPSVSFLHKRQK